jgi:hypothetical protein
LAILFGVGQAVSVFLFIINLWMSMASLPNEGKS